MLASLEDGRMRLEEVYRFENGLVEKDGELCWDHERLYGEILKGMRRCKEIGKIPESVGVDTWGVDFVLLDKNNRIIGNTVSYRDGRTKGMDELVYELIPEKELYARTGIQKAMYNTIYQLMAVKTKHPEYLENAERLLFTPDYFHMRLSGKAVNEYTIATTSQLITPATGSWDYKLLEKLGYPKKLFGEPVVPGKVLGGLTPECIAAVGYDCKVVLPASHDTASAVLAVPSVGVKSVYISSGTWSLMGVERGSADCSEKARLHNMTNEGGYGRRYRFLKNIMGMWMIQSVKKESGTSLSYAEICEEASKQSISSVVDCYDERFLAPENMTKEIADACRESGQQVPADLYETACVIYKSLAKCYADTISEIEEMTYEHYDCINVVGGGSNAEYLNRLTAEYTGRTVYAGPGEATAIGNVAAQMLADRCIPNLASVRRCIFDSFGVNKYE
ncbi:MAG: rhamnulokinase [Butyrivibrio sp.]|nr:rhamnulokinase [Butyrivibrio sp.]